MELNRLLARITFCKMSRALFVQMNGLGLMLWCAMYLRIPVNVTADSGNVTGIPANVTEGRCCAF